MCTIGPGRLIELVNHLADRMPHVELKLKDAPGETLIEALLAGDIDVALVGLPNYPEQIQAMPLYQEGYLVAFPPGHRFERVDSVTLSDLSEEPYLSRRHCEYPIYHQSQVGPIPYDFNVRYESEHEDWIQAMVATGLGCTLLPEFSVRRPDILTRPLRNPRLSRMISLLTVRGRPHTPVVEGFSRLCCCPGWR